MKRFFRVIHELGDLDDEEHVGSAGGVSRCRLDG